MSQQLRLLPAPKPLTERFGAAFFRGLPRAPGVYRMFDETGLLLYVGQSRDLHDRLNSYRHVHPDRESRKTVRLVHLVRRIEGRCHMQRHIIGHYLVKCLGKLVDLTGSTWP